VRRKNLDTLERIEREEVRVASDDVGCMATRSEFEKLVVRGITAGCYSHIHIDPLSLARQSGDKDSNVFLIDISSELFSVENFIEFGERCKRKQHFSSFERQVKSFARFRIG